MDDPSLVHVLEPHECIIKNCLDMLLRELSPNLTRITKFLAIYTCELHDKIHLVEIIPNKSFGRSRSFVTINPRHSTGIAQYLRAEVIRYDDIHAGSRLGPSARNSWAFFYNGLLRYNDIK